MYADIVHRSCAVASATSTKTRPSPGLFSALPSHLACATTKPAFQPGARPSSGKHTVFVSTPLRTRSQEMTELEFHISPTPH